MKIAALWIAKNEGEKLVRSIESVAAAADELVVVDTGSTDDTAALAEKAGARVERFEWADDFAAARNFALEQTDADAVIFLDADEWFEPALTAADRVVAKSVLADEKLDAGLVQMTNIDTDSGMVSDVGTVTRLMRGKGAVEYHGRIHESLRPVAGGAMELGTVPGWNLNHDGYSASLQQQKVLRNLHLLEQAVEAEPDESRMVLYKWYLMRENAHLGRREDAFNALQWLVEKPKVLRRFMRDYPEAGYDFIYEAVRLGHRFRAKVSRRQLRAAIVENAESLYTHHPCHHTIGLYFDLYFDDHQDRLLAELAAAADKAEAQRAGELVDMDDYLRANIELFTAAGEAALLRGEKEQAFDFATRAVRQSRSILRGGALELLLRCVKGLPAADVINFLNAMTDLGSRANLETLISVLHHDGQADLYAYYMKKLLDAGWAKKSDFWYLMILLEKPREAITAALQALESTEEEVVRRTLFLAVLCAGAESRALYGEYKDELGRYQPLADYVITGNPPPKPDFELARENYAMVAFAGGRRVANRMMSLYTAYPRARFLVQAGWYMGSGLYAELLQDVPYAAEADEEDVRLLKCRCHLMAGNWEDALLEVKVLLANSPPQDAVFNLAGALAHAAGNKAVKEEAGQLVAEIWPLFEEMTDWRDIANTGYAPGEENKKQRRALAQLTVAQFDKSITLTGYRPLLGQLEAATGAAAALLEKQNYPAALEPLRRRLEYGAAGPDTWKMLARVFDGVGNAPLAKAMGERVIGG